jgi:hypothetical protein
MSNITLRFPSLEQLGTFLKTVQPNSYYINTLQLTLSAELTSCEMAAATEQFSATYNVRTVLVEDINE